MSKFILISSTLQLFMFSIWNWLVIIIALYILTINDAPSWNYENILNLNLSFAAACMAFIYFLIMDIVYYLRASKVYERVNRDSIPVKYFLDDTFKELVNEYVESKKQIIISDFYELLVSRIFKKYEKYKESERSVWE